jgi:hypothetical protein
MSFIGSMWCSRGFILAYYLSPIPSIQPPDNVNVSYGGKGAVRERSISRNAAAEQLQPSLRQSMQEKRVQELIADHILRC